jgi:Uma2 family endonuclease
MESQAPPGLTWTQLQSWPEDGRRHELIGGELVVTPAPAPRHQRTVLNIVLALGLWARQHDGEVIPGPIDVYVNEREYTEPDVIYLRPGRADLFDGNRLPVPPDLIVEVSSPSTRARDLGAKRHLYQRFGVPEYWFVDLERDTLVVHVLTGGKYQATLLGRDDVLAPLCCPGLQVPVDEVIPAP